MQPIFTTVICTWKSKGKKTTCTCNSPTLQDDYYARDIIRSAESFVIYTSCMPHIRPMKKQKEEGGGGGIRKLKPLSRIEAR